MIPEYVWYDPDIIWQISMLHMASTFDLRAPLARTIFCLGVLYERNRKKH
jgi:hypothetical protein